MSTLTRVALRKGYRYIRTYIFRGGRGGRGSLRSRPIFDRERPPAWIPEYDARGWGSYMYVKWSLIQVQQANHVPGRRGSRSNPAHSPGPRYIQHCRGSGGTSGLWGALAWLDTTAEPLFFSSQPPFQLQVVLLPEPSPSCLGVPSTSTTPLFVDYFVLVCVRTHLEEEYRTKLERRAWNYRRPEPRYFTVGSATLLHTLSRRGYGVQVQHASASHGW